MTDADAKAWEIAEMIGKKAVSDDYIEDGGYIRDWLVNDIAVALQEEYQRGWKESKDDAWVKWQADVKEADAAGYKRGVEEAAKAIFCDHDIETCICSYWQDKIRALAKGGV